MDPTQLAMLAQALGSKGQTPGDGMGMGQGALFNGTGTSPNAAMGLPPPVSGYNVGPSEMSGAPPGLNPSWAGLPGTAPQASQGTPPVAGAWGSGSGGQDQMAQAIAALGYGSSGAPQGGMSGAPLGPDSQQRFPSLSIPPGIR
jgi:hypothetical protein